MVKGLRFRLLLTLFARLYVFNQGCTGAFTGLMIFVLSFIVLLLPILE